MYKKDVETLEQIEEYVANPYFKIRFSDKTEKHYKLKKDCRANMIYLIDLMLMRKLPTVHAVSGKPHCGQGRYRSIYDILLICKYYNQNITIKEVFEVIKKVLKQDKELGFTSLPYFSYCPDIKKWNFRGVTSAYQTAGMLRDLKKYDFKDNFPNSKIKVSDFINF